MRSRRSWPPEAVALHPATAFEALLAAEVVTANAFAKDSLRLATEHRDDFTKTLRCRAQACAMMWQWRQALRMLEDMQKARRTAAPTASAPGADQRLQPRHRIPTKPEPPAIPRRPPRRRPIRRRNPMRSPGPRSLPWRNRSPPRKSASIAA